MVQTKMDERCENCGGVGYVIIDEYDPTKYYGHKETKLPCACQPDDDEEDYSGAEDI